MNQTETLRERDRRLALRLVRTRKTLLALLDRTLASAVTGDERAAVEMLVDRDGDLRDHFRYRRAGRAVDLVRAADQRVVTALESRILPALADLILAATPMPGGEVPQPAVPVLLPEAVRMSKVLDRYVAGLLGRPAQVWALRHLAERLAGRVAHHLDDIGNRLKGSDIPDIRAAAFDQLRVDVLLWLLEDLNYPDGAEIIRVRARANARMVLRRAGDLVGAFLRHRGLQERFEVAAVTVEVEELIALVERIQETDARGAGDLFEDLDRSVVRDFLEAMGKLSLAVYRDLDDLLAADGLTPDVLRGRLRQVEKIHTFCGRVDHPHGLVVRRAVDRIIARKTRALAGRLGADRRRELAEVETFLVRLAG